MNTYILNTKTTMKPHNNKNWWIDRNIVPEFRVSAESITEALKKFREFVEEKCYITISNTAIKTKQPMYVDTKSEEMKQIGYVITGQMEFEAREYDRYSKQYIDLWVEIITVVDTEF